MNFTQYNDTVYKFIEYLDIYGMYELIDGNTSTYYPYNTSLNENIYTWKKYNFSEPIRNSHGLLEIKFNISDVTLMGSQDGIELVNETISRLQTRLSTDRLLS